MAKLDKITKEAILTSLDTPETKARSQEIISLLRGLQVRPNDTLAILLLTLAGGVYASIGSGLGTSEEVKAAVTGAFTKAVDDAVRATATKVGPYIA